MAPGFRFIPDPFLDAPPGFSRVIIALMLLTAIVASGWIMCDTQRAMNWMARRGPEWWPGRATAIRLANKPAWVWFYRIDGAVVFVGTILMLVSHLVSTLTQ
jgi:hypothetical protein